MKRGDTLMLNGPMVLGHQYPTYFMRRWHEKLRARVALWILKSIVRREEICQVTTTTS